MKICVNGQEHAIEKPCTVKELLQYRGLGSAVCAVEVNRTLIPKPKHQQIVLNEGDTIEIVTLVGGG